MCRRSDYGWSPRNLRESRPDHSECGLVADHPPNLVARSKAVLERNARFFPRCIFTVLQVVCRALESAMLFQGGASCKSKKNTSKPIAFEVSSKRRKGYPSETHVRRGDRVVGGTKELLEKLGRNDPCPCGSGRRFQTLLYVERRVRWVGQALLFPINRGA